jgi:hypothetical protein
VFNDENPEDFEDDPEVRTVTRLAHDELGDDDDDGDYASIRARFSLPAEKGGYLDLVQQGLVDRVAVRVERMKAAGLPDVWSTYAKAADLVRAEQERRIERLEEKRREKIPEQM